MQRAPGTLFVQHLARRRALDSFAAEQGDRSTAVGQAVLGSEVKRRCPGPLSPSALTATTLTLPQRPSWCPPRALGHIFSH